MGPRNTLRRARPLLAGAIVFAAAAAAGAQSAPDLSREHPGYELLETLDTAGLIHSRLSTVRGLPRTEVARLLLEARDALDDQAGYDAIATRVRLLLGELRAEVDVLRGADPALAQAYWKPVDRVGWSVVRRGGPRAPDATQGRDVVRGHQLFGWMETHGAWGPVSFAFEPELRHYADHFGLEDERETRGRLLRGYGRVSLIGLDITAGKLTPDWGPWHPRGGDALIFAGNAGGFPGISIRTSEPVLLPWIFSAIGPIGWEVFTGRLERGRPVPRALLGGVRAMWRPWPFLEVSLHRAFMFGGDDRPLNPGLMLAGTHDNVDKPTARDLSNQVGGADVRIRIPLPAGMGALAYGEFFGEDEAGGYPSKWSHRIGLHLAGIPPWRGVELRIEHSQIHRAAYRHGTYTGGWVYRDDPLGHHVGAGAGDVSGELIVTPRWPVAWGLVQLRAWASAEIRGRRSRPGFPGEEHRQVGGEIAWQSALGVRLAVQGWWLHINRVGGVHGTDDDGSFLGLTAEVTF